MYSKMKLLTSCFLTAMFLAIYFASNAQGEPARLLMKFNKTRKTFELQRGVLEEFSRLQRPIRVIAVVGDARIGKSTTLNLISHIWTRVNRNYVEEIFETGDTLDSVTRDVWCHIIQDERRGNVVLLDVEGTNLGDDALTIQLSMFTALISSGLNVFVREVFQNNNLHFLFHMSRLSDLVFLNISMCRVPSTADTGCSVIGFARSTAMKHRTDIRLLKNVYWIYWESG